MAENGSNERLYLADALALAYRAHFAFISRPLTNSNGDETSAAYGFTASLLKLLEDERPEHIAVVFDPLGGKPNFRDELYAEYKSNRPPMPEGIRFSLPYIKRIVEAFDIPVLEVEGVEADDVIGTLAKRAEAEDVDVVIFSADKDFRQLLSEHVSMLRPAYKGESFDLETAETFREKYDGLDPEQFVDMLALMGDSSDNVPGVPGIGEKTAVKLLKEYGSVEELLEHAEDVKGKRAREGLTEHRADAVLSKKLVRIHTDLDLDVDWHRLRRTDPDVEAVEEIFDELEFGSRLRKRIAAYASADGSRGPGGSEAPDGAAGTAVPTYEDPDISFDFGPYEPVERLDEEAVDYDTALNRKDLARVAEEVRGHDRLAFDTETTSTDQMMASLVGVSLSWQERLGRYVPSPMPDGTPEQGVLDALRPALTDDALKIGHNTKYDLVVLARHGLEVQGPLFDTMVAHYLIAPEEPHNLDAVSSATLNYRPKPITDLIGTGRNQISMRDVPVEEAGPYACEDADIAFRLVEPLREKLEADGLLRIAEEIEFPLIRVLASMEMEGVRVDPAVLESISAEITGELEQLEKQIYELAGEAFGIGSTKQLGEVLFEKLNLPVVAKTPSGAPSTRENVLLELATEHPLPGLVLDWRKLTKLQSTYVDKLGELIHPETGRVHTDFNQAVTATGRLSSSNPNLQNIPIRTEMGREIRRAFVADAGHVLMAADYAQIELRLLAHLSGDEGLIEAFQQGLDIHTATAARVFDKPLEDVSRTMRNRVKQVNYGIPYGISAFGLAQRMRISNKEAQGLIDQYRKSYPKVIRFLDGLVEEARDQGYVETLYGRRRYIPQIHARNPRDRAYAERIAVNMPIQGTQADMIKLAMVRLYGRIREEGLGSRMILQVHDELIFEVPEGEEERMEAVVREEMAGALPLKVPVVVDVGFGQNWLDAH
ncbi:MAG: DNA polymerase I [Rhodothermales bacterium]|nr:DNA polymerase I [Rhodothermales bacterium]